jgi:hypothetical protein
VIFRREPLHKKLAREGKLEVPLDPRADPEPFDPGPNWGATGIHGVPRPRRWDFVGSAEAPGLEGNEVHFIALPDGDLVVDEDEPADTLAPLAETVEEAIEPPYRAEAVRRDGDVWAVAARRVEIAQIQAPGDELQLVVNEGERVLTVDGERTFGSLPELQRLGEREGESYVVRARRLDDRLWEVEASPL